MIGKRKYPAGKISTDDEGELNVTIFGYRGKVRVEFGKPLAWLAMEPWRAREFAEIILRKANEVELELLRKSEGQNGKKE